MKTPTLLLLLVLVLFSAGCRRNGDVILDDTRSASRHMSRGLKILCGLDDESRMVNSRDEFYAKGNHHYVNQDDLDFVPLMSNDRDSHIAMADVYIPQPKESPGDPGSTIPGIDRFRDPSSVKEMAEIFKNLHFSLDSSAVSGEDNVRILRNIANYMVKHPNVYIFVEGHCDERGPEAYNLALGTRRSQTVRKMLIAEGISPDRIFTVSYGKEKPLLYGHDDHAWSQNRRAEFKVYHHQ